MALTGVLAFSYLAMLQRRRDIDTEFWSKLWLGRPGKFVFAIARKLLGKRAPGAAMTHRATELSIGMAAESLYENLPAEIRETLRDVPSLVRQLQNDAQSLRARLNDLQEALNTAGDAGSSDEYDNVRADRDAMHAKLGEAVGALETIRLNLLRLHAGSGSIESFTTHIELAAEVSAEVGRLLEAQNEVERGLAFPREDALTPV